MHSLGWRTETKLVLLGRGVKLPPHKDGLRRQTAIGPFRSDVSHMPSHRAAGIGAEVMAFFLLRRVRREQGAQVRNADMSDSDGAQDCHQD